MQQTTINTEILAQRLTRLAEHYETLAENHCEAFPAVCRGIRRQADECKQWAEAFRNIRAASFDADGNLVISG